MPDPAMEFTPYAIRYTMGATEMRKKFSHLVQVAILNIIDDLANNPEAYPDRCRPISRDSKTRVYIHPDPHIEVTFEVDKENCVIYYLHFAAPQMQLPRLLFISYSHKDEEWLVKLKKRLRPLEQAKMIRVWDDSKILAGSQWKEEIQQMIGDAKVALLLVSENFLTSDFIAKNELPPLLEAAQQKGVLVLWLALSSMGGKEAPIAGFQGLNDPERPLSEMSEDEQKKILRLAYKKIKRSLEAVH